MSADTPARIPPAREPGEGRWNDDSLTNFVFRSVVPGFIATVLVGIGSLGVGWLPLQTSLLDAPVVDALRSTTLGAVVSKGAVVIGIALLLQSWLLLGHDVMRGRVKDIKRLWLAMAAWSIPLILTPPLFSRDVYSYFAQGKLMAEGIDPYTHGSSSVPGWFNDGVDPLWGEAPTPYGQFWLLLSRGVAEFTPHPYSGAIVFRLIALAGVVLLVWAIPKLAFACGVDASKALWLGALNPLVLMHFVSGAHNDALMIGLVAAGLAWVVLRHPFVGIVLITLGGSVKPIGLVALPFAGLLWAGATAGWRKIASRWLITLVIAGILLGAFALVTHTGLGWINALKTPGSVRTWLSPPTALGMGIGSLLDLVGVHVTDGLVAITRLMGTLAGFGLIGYLCLRPKGRTPIRGAALAFLALVVFGPVVQPWYLLWCIPLFAASGLSRLEFRIALIGSSGFVLYGLATSSATQDSLLQIPDAVAVVSVMVVIGLLLAVSPRERMLLMGDPGYDDTLPQDAPTKARAKMLTYRGPDPEISIPPQGTG